MKRVLLISYVFPPEPSPGALRPSYLARYLPQFGWEATVLTHSAGVPPFSADVVRTEDVALWFSRLPYRLQDAILVPDTTVRWVPRALETGTELLKTRTFDAILGTALPASVHVVGAALARRSGLPWIADYRDPWTPSSYVRRGPLRGAFEHRLERKLLAGASAITTISEPIAQHLRRVHAGKDVSVIPNGHDPAEWDTVPAHTPQRFDLVYTGSMYDGKRSPELLFRALDRLRAEGSETGRAARVHFYGPSSGNVTGAATQRGLGLAVRVHGVVSRGDAMRAQRSAAALLIFLNTDPATSHELGSKILEYAGARRPILAFGPRDSTVRAFIERHGLGWFASNEDEAVGAVQSAYAHFLKGSPDLENDTRALPSAVDVAREFARRLDAVSPARTAVKEAS